MQNIHIYQMRHLFAGDDHIGKYQPGDLTVYLRDEYSGLDRDVKAFFNRQHGIMLRAVLVGSEKLVTVKAIREFPPEVAALKSPMYGDLTPEVVEWARKNWPREDFFQRYQGCPEYDTGEGETAQDPEPEKSTPARKPKATES